MERTARLVRVARSRLSNAQDLRGAIDVAAALRKSVGSSGVTGKDADTEKKKKEKGVEDVGFGRSPGTGPGRRLSLAASSAQEAAQAAGGAGRGSGLELAQAVSEKIAALAGMEKGVDAVGLARSHATGPGRGLSVAASLGISVAASPASPAKGLFLTSSPVREASSASASATACSGAVFPSFLHDKDVVCSLLHEIASDKKLVYSAEWFEELEEDGTTRVDVSQEVTGILKRDQGPVSRFQIDSSRWSDSECLSQWIDLLSEKTVEELILLNLGHRVSSIFPIKHLQSKFLRVLKLAFLKIPLDLSCFDYRALQIMDLFCCEIESNKLAWVVKDCVSLKELGVQYCVVDLKINSNSLEILRSQGNKGNRILIESAPKLLWFVADIIPNQKCAVAKQKICATISINNAPSLAVIEHLTLSYHKINVNSLDITKDVGLLHCLNRLKLSMEMGSPPQLLNLRKLLESFPLLQELVVLRTDTPAPDEHFHIWLDKPFEDLDIVDCVKNCLSAFTLLDFQGGESEKHLIQAILKNASHLKELRTSKSENASKRFVREAGKEIRSFDRASETCLLTFE